MSRGEPGRHDATIDRCKLESRRIALNGRFLAQPISGVQRYARELIRALDRVLVETAQLATWDITIWAPPNVAADMLPVGLQVVKVRQAGRRTGHIWEQIDLPRLAGNALLVSLTNSAPLAHPRQLIAIHDAAIMEYPADFRWNYRAWYRTLYFLLRHTRARFISVSAFAAAEVSRHFGISPNRISIIPNAADSFVALEPDRTVLDRLRLPKNAYVLAVGGRSPRKNLGVLEKAMASLESRPVLVVAGGGRSEAFAAFENALGPQSISLDYVSDAAMKALYQDALCLVFPSRYEGFGLPPLEAMSCGCPVVVSRAASMPEVCGDAALYCHPDQPETIATSIELLMTKPGLREDLIERGLERAKRYSWDQSAHRLLHLLQQQADAISA